MTVALMPMLVESVVTLSTKVAVDGLVKIATPPGVKAVSGFLIKAGTFFIGAAVASKLSALAVKSTEELTEIVKTMPVAITAVEPPQTAI